MTEPTIWFQLGLSESQANSVAIVVRSILKTREKIGTMLLMVKDSSMTTDEKQYATFLVAKEDIARRLISVMPAVLRPVMEKALRE